MKHISPPNQFAELRHELVKNLSLEAVETGEIDAILKEIDFYDRKIRQKILALTLAFSHASSSLVPPLLRHIKAAEEFFSLHELDQWVSEAFDLLDSDGMDQALAFLSRVDDSDLKTFLAKEGLHLSEAAPMLEIYVRAISGRELKVDRNDEAYTDTTHVFLPTGMNRFPERTDNLLLYKLASAYCWAQVALGTLTLDMDLENITTRFGDYTRDSPDIETFFNLFPESQLAIDLYTIIESFRIERFLIKELPGLMKQAVPIKSALGHDRPDPVTFPPKTAFVEGLWQYYLTGAVKSAGMLELRDAVAALSRIEHDKGPIQSVKLLYRLYDAAVALAGDYEPGPAPLFIGRIRPEKVSARLRELNEGQKKKLEIMVAKLIEMPDFAAEEHYGEDPPSLDPSVDPAKEYLMVKGKLMEVDEELKTLIEEKGGVPGGVLVKGSEIGGSSLFTVVEPDDEKEIEATEGGIKYDEWDYKRGGYKKRWCSLYEHDVQPGDRPFVERTLKRYSGYVTILRKKFELLKRERRLKRRQKDGDDIDFDAMVESFSDIRAGISPSENVFTRVDRHERNIAVLFLLDMSGSTKGWVNQAEKEALVLLSEALETLGDRYAVYGFSGMTRNRCDLYRVKGFNEPYNNDVKWRIAGITTKDYTRMGPFIRHTAGLLKEVEARTKLLITLSDGKPEDWDGYKGDYGIEDTRKAIIETGALGIHSFCITIDHEAQSYLPHLFGKGNYIFIDDVRKLPNRITEIYRRLTT